MKGDSLGGLIFVPAFSHNYLHSHAHLLSIARFDTFDLNISPNLHHTTPDLVYLKGEYEVKSQLYMVPKHGSKS